MSNICEVTGRRPRKGNRVSHSNNKTKRWFKPNVQSQRFYVPSEGRWVRLKVSARAIREIEKRGIEVVLAEMRKGTP